jgi:hypothetical protein
MISKPHDIFSIFSLLFDFDMLIEARKDRRRLIGKIERCEQQQQKHGAHSRPAIFHHRNPHLCWSSEIDAVFQHGLTRSWKFTAVRGAGGVHNAGESIGQQSIGHPPQHPPDLCQAKD